MQFNLVTFIRTETRTKQRDDNIHNAEERVDGEDAQPSVDSEGSKCIIYL